MGLQFFFQERTFFNLGGCDYKESQRRAGAKLMSPELQGLHSRTGFAKKDAPKEAFNQYTNVLRCLYCKFFVAICMVQWMHIYR